MIGRYALLLLPVLALGACSSLSEKSESIFADKPAGLNHMLDTESKEEKEESAWFKSFYGKNHCGVWEGSCEPGADSGGGGGGFWGGGVGPSDGGSVSHSDSGSSN